MDATPGPIVVPLDGSVPSRRALPFAAKLARSTGSPVHFVHVPAESSGPAPDPGEESLLELAARLYAGFEPPSSPLTVELEPADPAAAVVDYAATASFIVLGSHGRGGLHAKAFGSVADRIIRGAPCPVLVVPGVDPAPSPEIRTLVVALGPSREAEAGLAVARDLGATMSARLVLVRVVSPPPPRSEADVLYQGTEGALEELEAAASLYLTETARAGEDTIVLRGDPEAALAELAESNDDALLVLTSTGKGVLRRFLVGTVSEDLRRSLSRPVLIVPASLES